MSHPDTLFSEFAIPSANFIAEDSTPSYPSSSNPSTLPSSNSSSLSTDVDLLKAQVIELHHMIATQQETASQQAELLKGFQTLLLGVSTPKKLPNLSPPDPYDGTPSKSQSFLNSVNIYIDGRKAEFPNPVDKVFFAISYMKTGKAKTWVDNLLKKKPLIEWFPKWEDFVEAFQRKFSNPLAEETARRHLKNLRQGTQSVEDYITTFEEYETETGYDDTVLKELFEEGLSFSLQKRIYELQRMPRNLTQWKTEARKLDEQRLRWEAKKKQNTSQEKFTFKPTLQASKSVSVPKTTDGTGTTFGGSGEAMDIDAAKRQGLCFICKQKGHISKFCPTRKPPQVRQVNMADMTQEQLTALIEEWNNLHGKKEDF
jgi:hypothetical protein